MFTKMCEVLKSEFEVKKWKVINGIINLKYFKADNILKCCARMFIFYFKLILTKYCFEKRVFLIRAIC